MTAPVVPGTTLTNTLKNWEKTTIAVATTLLKPGTWLPLPWALMLLLCQELRLAATTFLHQQSRTSTKSQCVASLASYWTHVSQGQVSVAQPRSHAYFWAYVRNERFSFLPRPTSKVWFPVRGTTSSPDEWCLPLSICAIRKITGSQKHSSCPPHHLSRAHWESWDSTGQIVV